MSDDVRGLAVSVTDDARRLREKTFLVWKDALRVIQQPNPKTAAHTPLLEEAGNRFTFDGASDVNFTMDATHPDGWFCWIVQLGAGRVTCVAAAGGTVNTALVAARTRAQYSRIFVEVIGNTDGQSAAFVVSGDAG